MGMSGETGCGGTAGGRPVRAARIFLTSLWMLGLATLFHLATAPDPALAGADAKRVEGSAEGWAVERSPGQIAASTITLADGARGVMLLVCRQGRIGWRIALDSRQQRTRFDSHDGMLLVYDEGEAGKRATAPLAQIPIRFLSSSEFRSSAIRDARGDDPDRLVDLITASSGRLRLVTVEMRPDRFRPPNEWALVLPPAEGGLALPRNDALAALREAC